MKDLHSHICYGIDDGCKTIEESISILRKMEKSGITDIFLTPHYIEDSKYNANNKKKQEIIDSLKEVCQKENININLYLGNEVYLTDNVINLVKKGEIKTLNDSKYILLELPMFQKDPNTRTILHNVITAGYIPIIAHPERYAYVDEKLDYIRDLQAIGVLFQGNYQSLFGKYGKQAKKNLQKMLKDNIISFLGTDIHHEEELHTEKLFKEIKKFVKKEDKVYDLLYRNIDKILDSE